VELQTPTDDDDDASVQRPLLVQPTYTVYRRASKDTVYLKMTHLTFFNYLLQLWFYCSHIWRRLSRQ